MYCLHSQGGAVHNRHHKLFDPTHVEITIVRIGQLLSARATPRSSLSIPRVAWSECMVLLLWICM